MLLGKDASLAAVDKDGQTPLHLAANGNEVEVTRQLFAAGADPRAVDGAGKEPKDLTDDDDIRQLLQ
jgi:ankyrin repeat protein